MDSRRQNKVGTLLQEELAQLFQRESKNLFNGAFITVTQVRVAPDLSVARVFLSIMGKAATHIQLQPFTKILTNQ